MPEQLQIIISGDAKKLISALKQSGVEVGKFSKTTKQTSTTVGGLGSSIGGLASSVVGPLALAGAMSTLASGAQRAMELAREQARVEAQLDAVLRSTGNAAGLTAEEIKKMASELQGVTNFGDEATIAGQNMLLTFTNIGRDVFPRATSVMLDLSTAMGQDLKTSAIQVGKALNDPVRGLSNLERVGIQFNESQKQTIETLVESGEVMKAQEIILGELEKQFGGSAEAAREADGGAIAASNAMGDLGEVIGSILLPAMSELNTQTITTAETMTGFLQGFKEQADSNREATAAIQEYGLQAMAVFGANGQLLNSTEILAEAQRLEAEAARDAAQASQEFGEAQRAAGLMAVKAAEAQKELENRQRAQSAESARWAGIAEENVSVLDELAQGHLNTAEEAHAYAEAQQAAIDAEEARLESARGLAGTMAEFFTGMAEQREAAAESQQAFSSQMAEINSSAGDKIKEQESSLSDELAEIEAKRQERLHFILTGAHDRSQAANDAELAASNAHFDELKNAAIAKSQEKTNAIIAEQERAQAAAEAARQAEMEAQAQHLEELKLQAALAALENAGQLEQFTGGLATSAADAAELINAGVLPVTEEMALAIQASLGELATQQEQAMATSQENQALLQEALAGTLEATTATDENTLLGQESVQEALNLTMENINTIAGESLPEMESSATSATDAAIGGLDGTTSSANIAAQAVEKVGKAGEKIKSKLIPALNEAKSKADALASALERAANAANDLSGGLGNTSVGGGRQHGGLVQRGITYLVGESGPEFFTAPTTGQIIPNQNISTTQNFNLNVSSAIPSAGISQDFRALQRAARA